MTYFLILWALAGTLPPLALLWALWRLVLRGERCFGYNRALLLLAPVLAVAWPLLPHPASFGPRLVTLAAPGTQGPVQVLLPTLYYANPADAAFGWDGWGGLLALYAAGVAVGLGWLGWRYGQLHRATARLPREARPGYVLACTGGRLPTSSFGRTVFWDDTAGLTAAEAAPVLAHELAHVRQGHSYDVLWLELWRIVLWPNPFAHLLLPALRLTHELLADRAAQASTSAGAAGTGYLTLLARLAARQLAGGGHSPLLQPFHFSFTLTRIAMLRTTHPVRRWKQGLVLPLLGGAFLVACQTTPDLKSVAPPPPPPPPILIKSIEMAGSKVDSCKLYTYVEQMPELPGGGGNIAIVRAIQEKLVYPKDAPAAEGNVFVQFVVSADGAVRIARVIKSLAPAYDKAVIAAVLQLPKFVPGRQDGQAVKVSFTVPVTFKAVP